MRSKNHDISEFIYPLNINRLEGRYLFIKASKRNKNKNILIVYDFGSNLEKMFGFALGLSKIANVTMVDIPGSGGMDSFYSIGMEANLDNYSDYLASIIKLKFRRKKLAIVGFGFGLALATRMLYKCSELEKNITGIAGIEGYVRFDDFKKINSSKVLISKILSNRFTSYILNLLLKNKLVKSYILSKNSSSPEMLFNKELDFENDNRSKYKINIIKSKIDICNFRTDIKAFNLILSKKLSTLDSSITNEHFRIIFKNYKHKILRAKKEAPSIFKDAADAKLLLDRDLLNFLRLVNKKT